jgi:hypothetical protein
VLHKEEVYFAFPLGMGEESQRLLNELTRQAWQCNRELRLCAAAVYEIHDLYYRGDLSGIGDGEPKGLDGRRRSRSQTKPSAEERNNSDKRS